MCKARRPLAVAGPSERHSRCEYLRASSPTAVGDRLAAPALAHGRSLYVWHVRCCCNWVPVHVPQLCTCLTCTSTVQTTETPIVSARCSQMFQQTNGLLWKQHYGFRNSVLAFFVHTPTRVSSRRSRLGPYDVRPSMLNWLCRISGLHARAMHP